MSQKSRPTGKKPLNKQQSRCQYHRFYSTPDIDVVPYQNIITTSRSRSSYSTSSLNSNNNSIANAISSSLEDLQKST